MRTQYFSALLLSGLATASPLIVRQATATGAASGGGSTGGGSGVDMVEAIKTVMPSSATCDGAQLPDECRTAEQAAPFVSKSCADLSDGEKAAVLALMAAESIEFKAKHNANNPGQGTANMMMPGFISQYASEVVGADKVAGKSPVEVLELVTVDEHNFGSAAWFLTTQCTAAVRDGLKSATDEAFVAYMMTCVQAGDGDSPKRLEYWHNAKKAFNL